MIKANNNLSARPKVRNSNLFNEAKIAFEPLNKKMINFIDQDGNKKSIPFISREFNLKMNCVTYYEPSFEELNNLAQMSLHNWIINCRKFEHMLHQLINLPYFRFWSVMSYNREVIESIDSYLTNASRSYRLHPVMKNIEVKGLLSNIHKLVFKLWIRVLLPKETERDYMLESYHFDLVREILDISKLFSLLQLYAYGSNSELLRQLLKPFISPDNALFKRDFTLICEDITALLNRCDFELQDEFPLQMYSLVSNVTDVMFSLNKLVLLEPKLSTIYVECDLHEALVAFYSKYFPFIESKSDEMYKRGQLVENLYKFLRSQFTLTQSSALLLFHHILQHEFIHRINQESADTQMFDALINILNTVIGQKRFCFDYFTRFSFENEFNSLLANRELNDQLSIGDVLEYYKITLKSTVEEHLAQITASQKGDESLRLQNLMSLDYQNGQQQQQQHHLPQSISEVVITAPVNRIRVDDEITAKESIIREMFPSYGDGFIYKCLEHYDFDNEKVLDAILECNLPPHLESLNHELTKSDLLRAQEAAIQREAAAAASRSQCTPTAIAQYDPTSKKDLVPTQIFIGKKDKFGEAMAHKHANKEKTMALVQKIDAEEEDAKEHVKTLIERGKLTKSDLESNIEYVGLYEENLYNDEFDDTYENEDVSFDAQDETFDDEDEDEEESSDQRQLNLTSSQGGGPAPPGGYSRPQRQNADKFAASQRYSKKQFYNKRNFNRGGGRPPAQQHQQHQQQQQQPQSGDARHQNHPAAAAASSQQQRQNHHHHQQQQSSNQHLRRNQPNNSSQPHDRTGPRSNASQSGQSGSSQAGGNSSGNTNRSNSNANRSQFRNPRMQHQNRGYQGGHGGR